MSYFAKNLKYLREKLGMSKSSLAKKMGVNQSTITRWEKSEMGITVDNAYDLSLILNVPLPELIGKDLQENGNVVEPSKTDKKDLLKQVFIEKGIMNKGEDLSEESFNRIMAFNKLNKDFLIQDNKKDIS